VTDQGRRLHAFSCAIHADEYRRIISDSGRAKFGHPYLVCFKTCIALLAKEMDDGGFSGSSFGGDSSSFGGDSSSSRHHGHHFHHGHHGHHFHHGHHSHHRHHYGHHYYREPVDYRSPTGGFNILAISLFVLVPYFAVASIVCAFIFLFLYERSKFNASTNDLNQQTSSGANDTYLHVMIAMFCVAGFCCFVVLPIAVITFIVTKTKLVNDSRKKREADDKQKKEEADIQKSEADEKKKSEADEENKSEADEEKKSETDEEKKSETDEEKKSDTEDDNKKSDTEDEGF